MKNLESLSFPSCLHPETLPRPAGLWSGASVVGQVGTWWRSGSWRRQSCSIFLYKPLALPLSPAVGSQPPETGTFAHPSPPGGILDSLMEPLSCAGRHCL